MKQFNGAYGCNMCLHPGGRNYRYYEAGSNQTQRRTIEHYQECLRSLQQKTAQEQRRGVFGVTGPTILSQIRGFNPVKQVMPDAMHCIFLGVTKQIIGLWFNSDYKDMDFYIKPAQRIAINKILCDIKTHSECTRRPRNITDFASYKASCISI
jgi:hypothetical protein